MSETSSNIILWRQRSKRREKSWSTLQLKCKWLHGLQATGSTWTKGGLCKFSIVDKAKLGFGHFVQHKSFVHCCSIKWELKIRIKSRPQIKSKISSLRKLSRNVRWSYAAMCMRHIRYVQIYNIFHAWTCCKFFKILILWLKYRAGLWFTESMFTGKNFKSRWFNTKIYFPTLFGELLLPLRRHELSSPAHGERSWPDKTWCSPLDRYL